MKQTHDTKIILTVLWVNKIFNGKVTFCGSFGLKLNGKIHREVHDVDCITDECYYGKNPIEYFPAKIYNRENFFYNVYKGESAEFFVDGVLVKIFKLISPQGIHVDVMFRPDVTFSSLAQIKNTIIKVEKPE